MGPMTAAARRLLLITLLVALFTDILLRVSPWGVNFSLSVLLLFAGIILLAHRLKNPIPRDAWPIVFLGLFAASSLAWRDARDLAALNVLGTFAAVALVTARTQPAKLSQMTFLDHLQQSLSQVFHLTVGFGFLLLRDVRAEGEEARASRWGRAWLGIALAVPALFLFGSLLTSADATFQYVIEEVLHIDFWTLMGHVFLISFLSWTIGGLLRGRFLATETNLLTPLRPKGLSLGILEVTIVLGSLDLLFGTFVLVQIPHFFGGHGTVLGTPALTYAEYARRGFFELIAVACLSLPLLLVADWLLRREAPSSARTFRALSIVMVALLGVMLASAVHRLWLYMDAYGLTVARVDAAAALLWIGLTLLLFCVTVLRGKRNRLPFAMVLAGFVVLIALNAADPDALVAGVNLERLSSDRRFDPKYTFNLSADAVPLLLEALPSMESANRSALAQHLLSRYSADSLKEDLRSWNAARARARRLVQEEESLLRGFVLPPQKSKGEPQ